MEMLTDQPSFSFTSNFGWHSGPIPHEIMPVLSEAQTPDAPNHPDFPSIILRPADLQPANGLPFQSFWIRLRVTVRSASYCG